MPEETPNLLRGAIVMNALEQEIRRLAPWFHNLHLPDGVQTAPEHRLGDFPNVLWQYLAPCLPQSLAGWTVLDIGCNAGFYSFELARRGANVLGIDCDPHYLEQANWAVRQLDIRGQVEFRQMQIYELARLNQSFDLVLFLGVFYHLRYPLLGLDLAAQKARRLLVFQSMCMPGEEVCDQTQDRDIMDRDVFLEAGWPKLAFIENRFAGDPTNWWVPNRAAIEALLRSSGLGMRERPHREIYVCEPIARLPDDRRRMIQDELASATGRERS